MDAATIITNTINQVGTDASRLTVLSLLNEAYQTQVAQSQWVRNVVSLGNTVAGTATYALPATVIDVEGLRVGAYPFQALDGGVQQMWDLQTQPGVWNGRQGTYAVEYATSGAETSIRLYPTPDTSGTAITALAAVLPTVLTDSGTSTPVTPVDLHGSLIDGTASLILLRVDERPDLAPPFEERFQKGIIDLRRRRISRTSAGNPMQALVEGIHW